MCMKTNDLASTNRQLQELRRLMKITPFPLRHQRHWHTDC